MTAESGVSKLRARLTCGGESGSQTHCMGDGTYLVERAKIEVLGNVSYIIDSAHRILCSPSSGRSRTQRRRVSGYKAVAYANVAFTDDGRVSASRGSLSGSFVRVGLSCASRHNAYTLL